MSQMFVKENSLKMYTIEELLIAYIDECEYLLLYPIRNIYSPKHMPLSMLHSLLFFLQEMNKYQIYPFMVNKLLNIIPSIYKSARNKNIIDEFVYRTLNHEYMNISNKISSDKIFYFLGEMGFYSLLYHSPEIFKNAYSQIEKQYNNFPNYVKQKLTDYSVNLDTLCGWGYGLLNN